MKTILFLIIQRRMFKSRWKKRWFMCSRIWSLLYMQENFIFFSHFLKNQQHFLKIVVTTGCGSSSSENCTYFEVSGANDGPCVGKICKCSSNICQVRFSKYIAIVILFGYLINFFQIRLDLTTFAITGPSTLTDTVGKMIGGQVTDGVTTGKLFNYAGNCFTDSFTVSGAVGVPPLCGTLSGEHGMYSNQQIFANFKHCSSFF